MRRLVVNVVARSRCFCYFFFSSRRRHTRWPRDWSSDVCSSDLIKLERVSKIFGSRPKSAIPLIEEGMSKEEILEKTGHTVGVYDASMEIKKGELFVVMGLSGSGKSTLIRCFNMLHKPTTGSVYIDGQDITKCKR